MSLYSCSFYSRSNRRRSPYAETSKTGGVLDPGALVNLDGPPKISFSSTQTRAALETRQTTKKRSSQKTNNLRTKNSSSLSSSSLNNSCRFFHGAVPTMVGGAMPGQLQNGASAYYAQQQQQSPQPPGGGQPIPGIPQHHHYQYAGPAGQEPNVINGGNYNRYAQTFSGGGGHQQQLHFGTTNSAPEQPSYLSNQTNGQTQDFVQASAYYRQPQNQRYSIDQAFIDQSTSSAIGYNNNSDGRMYNTNNSIAGMIGAEQLYANASAAAESAAKAFALQQQQQQQQQRQQQQQHVNGSNNGAGTTTSALTGGFHSQPFSSSSGVVYSGNQAAVNNVPLTKQEGFARVSSGLTENSNYSANSRIDPIDLPLDILDEPKTTLESYQ